MSSRRRLLLPLATLTIVTGVLTIASSHSLLPHTLKFVCKPLTTIVIIIYALLPLTRSTGSGSAVSADAAHHHHDHHDHRRRSMMILFGLIFSLFGDIFLLWPESGFIFGLLSFLIAHLFYIFAFTSSSVKFLSKLGPIIFYLILVSIVLSIIWNDIPFDLRIPVCAYVGCLGTMAAQSAVWWRTQPTQSIAQYAAIGGLLFLLSDGLLAIDKFTLPLPGASAWILVPYWSAQWCIASCLTEVTSEKQKSQR